MFLKARTAHALCLLPLALCLAACQPSANTPATAAQAPSPVSLDARLQGIYERACIHCHEVPGSGAPLKGDSAQWTARWTAGQEALLASIRQGKGTMPPMGWCAECTDTDFVQLIRYLQAPKE